MFVFIGSREIAYQYMPCFKMKKSILCHKQLTRIFRLKLAIIEHDAYKIKKESSLAKPECQCTNQNSASSYNPKIK